MNDQDRCKAADGLGDGFTRLANALNHVDRRRTALDGTTAGDDMGVFDRMRFAFQGQPRAARYDGDSESAPAREPRCTCGHTAAAHAWNAATGWCNGAGIEFPGGNVCVCRHFEPDNVRGLNSDPTGTAGIRPDKAAGDLKEHDRDVRAVQAILERMTRRVAKYGPARPASDADRANLAKTNTTAPKVCDSCGDLPLKVENSTVKGNLEKPGAYCDWCYRWIGTTGRKPTEREAEMHRSGKNPKPKADNHVGVA